MTDLLPDFGNDLLSTPTFETKDPPEALQKPEDGSLGRNIPVPRTAEQMFIEGDDPSVAPQPLDLDDPTQLRRIHDAVVPEVKKTPERTWGEWFDSWADWGQQVDKSVSKGAGSGAVTMGVGLGATMRELEENLPQAETDRQLGSVLQYAIEEKDPAKRKENMANIRAAVPYLFKNQVDRDNAQRLISDAYDDPEGFKILQDKAAQAWDPFEDQGFKALMSTQKWIDDTYKPSKDFAGTWPDKIAGGAGSMITFLAATYFGGSVTGFTTGALSGQGEAFQRALEAGVPPSLALKASMLGTIPGMTENVPIELLLKNPKMTNVLFGVAVRAMRQAVAEGGQEVGQQIMQNAIAQYLYKPDQLLLEGTKDSFVVGGLVGAGASAGVDLIGLRGRYYDEAKIRRLNEEWERQKARGAVDFDPGPIPPPAIGTPADPNANPLPPSVRQALTPEPAPKAPEEGSGEKPVPDAPQATPDPVPGAKLTDVAPGTPLYPGQPRAELEEQVGQVLVDGKEPTEAAKRVLDGLTPEQRKELEASGAKYRAGETPEQTPELTAALEALDHEVNREMVSREASQMRSTPAFALWFGRSQVVDEKGEPLVVYKGMYPLDDAGNPITSIDRKSPFPAFNGHEEGTDIAGFFTSDPKVASKFAEIYGGKDKEAAAPVFPAYLNMRHPHVIDAQGKKAGEIQFGEEGKPFRDAIRSGLYDGVIIRNTADEGDIYVPLKPTQIKSIFNEGTYDPNDPDISKQSTPLRTGEENLSAYGIDPGDKVKVREVAAALEARQRAQFGQIAFGDHSAPAMEKLSDWLATEVEFELQPGNIDKSAAGWYTDKFQRALDTFGAKYPELVDDEAAYRTGNTSRIREKQDARDLLTALFAITSDGQRVNENFKSADRVYAYYRENGVLPATVEGARGDRQASMVQNIARLQELIDQKGIRGATQYLLTERSVSEMNRELRAMGKEVSGKLPAGAMMPQAAVEFGPKLGAFYANLMGTQGYLTMDMWWARTFNRMRGTLLTKPSEAGMKRVGEMVMKQRGLKKPPSRNQLLKIVTQEAERYKAKGYKDGTELEKASNTIFKDAFVSLEEAPLGASDRQFMIDTAKRTQQKLRERGHDLTIADIQALIWYYEKRLYGELGAKQSDDISYEEAAQRAIAAEDLRQPGRADADAGGTDPGGAEGTVAPAGRGGGQDRQRPSARSLSRDPELYPRLKGLPERSPGPVPRIVDAAKRYAEISGIPYRRQAEHVMADPDRGQRIARAYDAMKHDPKSPEVIKAYRAMIDETLAQYQLVKEMGLTVEVIEDHMPNPYPRGVSQVLEDLQMNHLWLYPTDSGFGTINDVTDNPLLEPTTEKIGDRVLLANDVFRIVHDVFGHGKEGVGFGPSGEENAWQSHVRMYSDLAARAMTSETRGQNSWVNFGPYGEANRARPQETVFADQKAGLMPEWAMREGVADDTDPDYVSQILSPQEVNPGVERVREIAAKNGMDIITENAEAPFGPGRMAVTVAPVGGSAKGDANATRYEVSGWVYDAAGNITSRHPLDATGWSRDQTAVPFDSKQEAIAAAQKRLGPGVSQQRIQQPRGLQPFERARPKGGIAEAGQKPSMTKEEIAKTFIQALRLTVEQGRFGRASKGAEAIYKWGQSVARVSDRGNLVALFHEGAHHMHAMMGPMIDKLIAQNRANIEMIALKVYGGGGQVDPNDPVAVAREGFATFFQIWMNNPAEAFVIAPAFKQQFEALLNQKAPELAAAFKLLQEGVDKLVTEKPSIDLLRERIKPLKKVTTIDKIRTSIADGNFLHDVGTLANRIYQMGFDENHPLTVTMLHLKAIAESNVRRLMDQGALDLAGAKRVLEQLDKRGRANPIKMMWMAKNSYGTSTEMLATGIPKYNGNGDPVTLGIPAILAIAQGNAKGRLDPKVYADFNAYVAGRRIVQEWDNYHETRNWAAATERGLKYPEPRTKRFRPPDDISKDDAIKALTELHQKYPNFDRAAQELYKFQTALLEYRRDAGDLTDELYQYMAGMQNYVPLRRDMGDEEGISGIGRSKDQRTGKDDLIRVFRGSSRPIISPVDAIMQAVHEQISLTAHNQTKRALVDVALDVGMNSGAVVEKIPATQMKGTKVRLADVLKASGDISLAEEIAQAMGRDEITMQEFLDEYLDGDETATVWRSTEISEKGENIIYVRRNGNVEAYKLNDPEWADELYKTLTELGREQASVLINVLGKASAALRAGVTTAPPYLIANVIRDQLQAWILNDGVFPVAALGKGIKNDLFDRKSRRLYNLSGAAIAASNIAGLDRTRFGTEQSRLAKLGIGVSVENTLDGAIRVLNGSETWTRQGIWHAAFKKAKADGLSDGDAMAEAGFEASDYTNYGRAGSKMLGARRLITFLNANLQGLDKSVRVALGGEGGAAVLRKILQPWAARTFGTKGSRTSLPLTPVEKLAVQKGLRTITKMMSLSLISALLAALYWDDEEYDTMSPYLKGTRWMVKVAPGQWLGVPKPFQLAFFATATEYAIDGFLKDDPTALNNFLQSQLAVMVPPYENPAIRLAYETATNTNLFTGREIIAPEVAGMPSWMQYNQYTSELGKGIGRLTGASPMLVDHYITSGFATWGRGALALSNLTDPKRPAQGLDDMAFTSFFIKNGSRSSTVRPAFWDLMAMRGGELTGFAQAYKKLLDAGADGQAQEFLGQIPEEGRIFAQLYADPNGKWKVDGKRLHPLRNAYDVAGVISGIRKEITIGTFKADKGEGDPILLSPTQQKLLNDRLADLSVREMRNALVTMGEPGWGQRDLLPTLPIFEQIKAIDPKTAIELKKRMAGKVYAADVVRQLWPRVRNELLINGTDANLRPMINQAKGYGSKFFTDGETQ